MTILTKGLLSIAIASAAIPVPAGDGLIGHFPFNGNASDESGNSNDGVVHGATLTPDRFNQPESAYRFVNAPDRIALPDEAGQYPTNDFTIAAWIRLDTHAGGPIVDLNLAFSDLADRRSGIALFVGSNGIDRLALQFVSGAGPAQNIVVSNSVLPLDQWIHVAAVRAGDQTRFYINGELDVEESTVDGPVEYSSGVYDDDSVHIGHWFRTGGGFPPDGFSFAGDIDEVRIYSTALTGDEVVAIYNSEIDCPGAPEADPDNDGWCGVFDNCPSVFNDQANSDGDKFGDSCDNCWLASNDDQNLDNPNCKSALPYERDPMCGDACIYYEGDEFFDDFSGDLADNWHTSGTADNPMGCDEEPREPGNNRFCTDLVRQLPGGIVRLSGIVTGGDRRASEIFSRWLFPTEGVFAASVRFRGAIHDDEKTNANASIKTFFTSDPIFHLDEVHLEHDFEMITGLSDLYDTQGWLDSFDPSLLDWHIDNPQHVDPVATSKTHERGDNTSYEENRARSIGPENFVTLVLNVKCDGGRDGRDCVSRYSIVQQIELNPLSSTTVGTTQTTHDPRAVALKLLFNVWWLDPQEQASEYPPEEAPQLMDIDWMYWSKTVLTPPEAHAIGSSRHGEHDR